MRCVHSIFGRFVMWKSKTEPPFANQRENWVGSATRAKYIAQLTDRTVHSFTVTVEFSCTRRTAIFIRKRFIYESICVKSNKPQQQRIQAICRNENQSNATRSCRRCLRPTKKRRRRRRWWWWWLYYNEFLLYNLIWPFSWNVCVSISPVFSLRFLPSAHFPFGRII